MAGMVDQASFYLVLFSIFVNNFFTLFLGESGPTSEFKTFCGSQKKEGETVNFQAVFLIGAGYRSSEIKF